MRNMDRLPRAFWRLARFLPPRLAYLVGLGPLVGGFVLLLKATGRKTGLTRVTPLLYDEVDGSFYVATARGKKADWYRNVLANPSVEVQVGARTYRAQADPITDRELIIHYLQERLRRRPRIARAIFWTLGMGLAPSPEELAEYAETRGLVALRAVEEL